MKKPEIVHRNTLFQTPIFTIGEHKAKIKEKTGRFFTATAPDWINILAITSDKEVILVKQYRHGIDEITLEIPGGVVDSNDVNLLAAAQRELSEETGYISEKWSNLGKVAVNPAFMTNYCHFFLAEGCVERQGQNLDTFEEIDVEKASLSRFFEMIESEQIDHSLIVAAVGRFLLKAQLNE